ncbi:Solute carrier family 21 member 14 [Intoshia linei]|uniref:Solute carrier organic anion transporter family member n=1 Tax=Intoshia linei TaxID=1819745 RepID=A0A177B8M2_9BILA|nr:Solute carrier family 21 member 14 [Intoshia linei]
MEPSTSNFIENENRTTPKFGYFNWRPEFLQRLNSPVCLLASLCMTSIVQGMIINGFISTSITTLEKTFGFNSKMSGFLAASYDVIIVIVLIPISFFGPKYHKNKIIACSMILLGVGSILFALPHFTSYEYLEHPSKEMCNIDKNFDETFQERKSSMFAYSIFIISQLINGLACSTIFTLTYVILDENVSKVKSSIYLGIFYGCAVAGPGIGFFLNSIFLNIDGNFYSEKKFNSNSFYGAWWVGFLLSGLLAFIVAIPIFGFGPYLPAYEKLKRNRLKSKGITHESVNYNKKNLWPSLINLFKNKTYMFIVLSDSLDAFLLDSFILFIPKILETQFDLSPSKASILTGGSLIGGGVLGTIVSGLCIRNLHVKEKIKFGVVCIVLSLPFVCMFLMKCDGIKVAGIDVPYKNTELEYRMKSTCNTQCSCSYSNYDPFCHILDDKLTVYTSYCWGGCDAIDYERTENTTKYYNYSCRCLPKDGNIIQYSDCEKKKTSCTYFLPFIVCLFLMTFFTFMSSTPMIQGIMRCVKFTERSLAVGLGWIFVRIIGTIPGPIVFGSLIDLACVEVLPNKSCYYYDKSKLQIMTISIILILRITSAILLLLAAKSYKTPDKPVVKFVLEDGNGV